MEGAFIGVVYGLQKETVEERTNEPDANQTARAFMAAAAPSPCVLDGNSPKLHPPASKGGDRAEMAFLSHANHLQVLVIFLSLVASSELNNLWGGILL